MSKHKHFISIVIMSIQLFIIFLTAPAVVAAGSAEIASLGGLFDDPLLIQVKDNGLIGVFAEGEGVYQNRYFDDHSSGLILSFKCKDEEQLALSYLYEIMLSPADGSFFKLESGTHDLSEINTVRTTWVIADLLQLEQIISYEPGSYLVKKTFRITANTDISDIRLIHGIDLDFSSTPYVSNAENRIIVQEQDFSNMWQVNFYPDAASPWTQYFCGSSDQVPEQIDTAVLSDFAYPAAYLSFLASWEKAELSTEDMWSVTTYEDYTPESFSNQPQPTGTPEPTISPTPVPTKETEATDAPEPTASPTPVPTTTVATSSNPESEPTAVAPTSSSTSFDHTSETTTARETTVATTTASSTATSASTQPVSTNPTSTDVDPDQTAELVKTGEYSAITFGLVLLVVAAVLLISRIKLNKRPD